MAWFVCFHTHGGDCDPKINLGQMQRHYPDSQMSLLVLHANENMLILKLYLPSRRPLMKTCPVLIALNFCLSMLYWSWGVEVISVTLLYEISHASVPSLFAYFPFYWCILFSFFTFPLRSLLSRPLVLQLADKGITPFIDGSFHSLLLIKPASTS